MKAVIFDFGGTLDTNGIHWSEKFFDSYLALGIPLIKEEFDQAYCTAEPEVEKYISQDSTFKDVLQNQVSLQVDYLNKCNSLFPFLKKNLVIQRITEKCYNGVKKEMARSRELLLSLKNNYKLGVVSNFYGNLENVLNEFEISTYFDAVADSKLCGYKKPDSRLFKDIIDKLQEKAEDIIMVGDSYSRDIVPSKLLGCRTVWLNVKSWEKPSNNVNADFIIDDLLKLNGVIPLCE